MASSLIGIDSATDEILVRCVARKDARAMRVLFARHHRRVFLFLIRVVKDETLAEDVVSEVFLDVWRKAENFKEQSSVSHVADRDRAPQGADRARSAFGGRAR